MLCGKRLSPSPINQNHRSVPTPDGQKETQNMSEMHPCQNKLVNENEFEREFGFES